MLNIICIRLLQYDFCTKQVYCVSTAFVINFADLLINYFEFFHKHNRKSTCLAMIKLITCTETCLIIDVSCTVDLAWQILASIWQSVNCFEVICTQLMIIKTAICLALSSKFECVFAGFCTFVFRLWLMCFGEAVNNWEIIYVFNYSLQLHTCLEGNCL